MFFPRIANVVNKEFLIVIIKEAGHFALHGIRIAQSPGALMEITSKSAAYRSFFMLQGSGSFAGNIGFLQIDSKPGGQRAYFSSFSSTSICRNSEGMTRNSTMSLFFSCGLAGWATLAKKEG